MKKSFENITANIVSWFYFNILFAFIPLMAIQFMNFIYDIDMGLKDIISDYAGLSYSTSVILIVCVFDYYKNNRQTIITNVLYVYGIVALMETLFCYVLLNFYNRLVFEELNEKSVLKCFIMLTIIMVLNILAILIIKIKEFSSKKKKRTQ